MIDNESVAGSEVRVFLYSEENVNIILSLRSVRMPDLNDLLAIGAVLAAVAAILAALVRIFKNWSMLWRKVFRPLLGSKIVKALIFFGILFIPNGAIIWVCLDSAVKNSYRLQEWKVQLFLFAQTTVFVSVYALIWGIYLYPKLRSWIKEEKALDEKTSVNDTPKKHRNAA